jgi:Rad3-related DNA helicase
MNLYVIAAKSTDEGSLDSPVFEVGRGTEESAVAVFLNAQVARAYIREAGWEKDQGVAQLEPADALKWLIRAHQDGVTHIAINPKRSAQLRGAPQDALLLSDPDRAHAELLSRLGSGSVHS